MFKKLTERHRRDIDRSIYINIDSVDMISVENGLTRLYIGPRMIDVQETPEQILDIQETVLITDKDDKDGGSRDEDGRVSNPA